LKEDEMFLDFDKTMRVEFKTATQSNINRKGLDFWESSEWLFFAYDYEQELKFTNQIWNGFPSSTAKIAVLQSGNEIYKGTDWEMWNVFPKTEPKYLIFTHGQMEKWTYLIEKYSDDTVYLKDLTHPNFKDIFLVRQQTIPKEKKDSICYLITNLELKTFKVIDFSSGFEKDSNLFNHIIGLGGIDTTYFKRSSLLNNQLTISFYNDFTYKIYEADNLKLNGNWQLSNTGKQIILNNGYIAERYIDIINLSKGNMTIGKMNKFQIEGEDGYAEYYYKIEMME
jgi:hypothetical protein